MSRFSDYLETLALKNSLPQTGSGWNLKTEWLFFPGMLFSSDRKWWGDWGTRRTAHEGIDITYYSTAPPGQNRSVKIKSLNDAAKVPAAEEGAILNICDDFLGKSVVVSILEDAETSTRILFVYAHVKPVKTLKTGMTVRKGQVIATVCNPYRNPEMPAHLHFSCFEIPMKTKAKDLNWDFFTTDPGVNIINPVDI